MLLNKITRSAGDHKTLFSHFEKLSIYIAIYNRTYKNGFKVFLFTTFTAGLSIQTNSAQIYRVVHNLQNEKITT